MDDLNPNDRADKLAADAEQILDRLDHDPPPRSRVERLDPTRLGRLILLIGAVSAAALAGTVVSIVLILVQFSTRAEVAERIAARAVADVAAQQQELARATEATRLADCALIDLFRVRPGDPLPEPGRGELVATRVANAYTARHCP